MSLKNSIKLEILNYVISELEKDILCEISNLRYGEFTFKYNLSVNYNSMNKVDSKIGDITIKSPAGRNSSYYTDIFYVTIKQTKTKFFKPWIKLTEEDIIINKIYDLFIERYFAKIRLKEMESNKKLLDFLPEERRKNIERELKLKRITKNENQ